MNTYRFYHKHLFRNLRQHLQFVVTSLLYSRKWTLRQFHYLIVHIICIDTITGLVAPYIFSYFVNYRQHLIVVLIILERTYIRGVIVGLLSRFLLHPPNSHNRLFLCPQTLCDPLELFLTLILHVSRIVAVGCELYGRRLQGPNIDGLILNLLQVNDILNASDLVNFVQCNHLCGLLGVLLCYAMAILVDAQALGEYRLLGECS